jgi:hypothetical protein
MSVGTRTRAALTAGVMALIVVAPAALGASPADRASATRAAAWLAGEQPSAMPAGQQADVMVAMRITGTAPRALASRLRTLRRTADGYADTAGSTAKVILGAAAAGANPARLGGVDYLVRLRRTQSSPGRFGQSAFDQGLAMIALRTATGRVPAGAPAVLLSLRSGPGWSLGLDPDAAPDVDSTALAVVALRAAGQSCSSPALQAARAWLATQRSGGGWTAYAGSPPSANSTALVARSQIACGGSGGGALRLIRSLQQRSGAITFTRAQPESRLLATTESVPALAGVSLSRGFTAG